MVRTIRELRIHARNRREAYNCEATTERQVIMKDIITTTDSEPIRIRDMVEMLRLIQGNKVGIYGDFLRDVMRIFIQMKLTIWSEVYTLTTSMLLLRMMVVGDTDARHPRTGGEEQDWHQLSIETASRACVAMENIVEKNKKGDLREGPLCKDMHNQEKDKEDWRKVEHQEWCKSIRKLATTRNALAIVNVAGNNRTLKKKNKKEERKCG